MLKLLIYGFAAYLGYKLYKLFSGGGAAKEQVKGKNRHEPLDLSETEIEDAHFEDVPEDRE